MHLRRVKESKKRIALVFPPVPSSSYRITMGIVERHMAGRNWTFLELPKTFPGESPFSDYGVIPDGMIVQAEARDHWIRNLTARKIPVVNCGLEWVGEKGVASVHYDYTKISERVVEHFSNLGFKRIAVIGHKLEKRPATRRTLEEIVEMAANSGYDSRLWELDGEDSPGLVPQRLLNTDHEVQLAAFLVSLKKPTAIFCLGDHIGFIVAAVAAQLGIKVPGSLAIAGFGDNMVANFANPPLTSFDGAAGEVGKAAADCITQWLEERKQPYVRKVIAGSRVIERESTVGKSGSVVIEAVHRHIETHSATGLTLDELVAVSGLSVKTLVLRYKEAFGIAPVDQIHRVRIDAAKSMLENPALTITEVSNRCGFTSQSAFSNYFHRHTGSSPGDFRKNDHV